MFTLIDEDDPQKVIVRITTSMWSSDRGASFKKDINFLVRKSEGFNFLAEDFNAVGAEEIIPRIINFHDVEDGIYQVVTTNQKRDWETGLVDEWDYQLIPYIEESENG